jgi:Tol biopolymer transport system component
MRRCLCGVLIFVGLISPIRAQETGPSPTPPTEEESDNKSPSPDGKFALLTNYESDLHTIDLIDARSKKVLMRVAEEDSEMVHYRVSWAPDSKRFALMTRSAHPIQGVEVYERRGDTFHKIKLPDLPTADIPKRLKRGKSFEHVANLNWQEVETWNKDGSLVVSVTTTIDSAEAGSITAERTVVVGFNRSGKARIVKSTIKYETAKD